MKRGGSFGLQVQNPAYYYSRFILGRRYLEINVYVFRANPVAGMQPDVKRATGGLDWGGGLPYLPP